MRNLNFFLRPPEKGGKFDLPDNEALVMLREPNPHGRPNSDVIRPWINGQTLVQTRQFQWIIDYPSEMPDAEATCYEMPWCHVLTLVKPERETNRDERLRRLWWIHRRSGESARDAATRFTRLVCTPRVSKHRLFAWIPAIVEPDTATYAFARADDYFFGVLQSRFHKVWALAQGTQLREKESGFRYTPTTCFETFPFPEAQAERDAAIAAAAKELNELRENWLNPPEWTRTEVLEFPGTVGGPWDRYIDPATVTDRGSFKVGTVRYPRLVARDADCAARLKERTLTKLYNERPPWLADCHARLDVAVAAAYGWPADLSDEAILERLLALNQAAAHGDQPG
jgi:hypothetical protein